MANTVESEYDVLIVGGGPGGLAAAHAARCALPNARVGVFDKASAFRHVGAFIGLQANGQSALGAIAPAALQSVTGAGKRFDSWKIFDANGMLLSDRPPSEMLLIAWYQVQQALLVALQQLRDDPVSIHTSSNFARYEEDAHGVTVAFGNGKVARCKVLIGADGAKSRVRAQCLGDSTAAYSGFMSCRALVEHCPEWWPHPNSLTSFGGQFMVLPLAGGQLSWGTQSEAEEASVALPRERSRQAAHARATAAFSQWPDIVKRLIAATPPEAVLEHAVYGREGMGPLPRWGRGRVTLLGDAAHVVNPSLGQGTSMALEDAAALGEALSEHGLGTEALRAYEDVRLPRVQSLADVTHKMVSFQKRNVQRSGRFDVSYVRDGQKAPSDAVAPVAPEQLKEVCLGEYQNLVHTAVDTYNTPMPVTLHTREAAPLT